MEWISNDAGATRVTAVTAGVAEARTMRQKPEIRTKIADDEVVPVPAAPGWPPVLCSRDLSPDLSPDQLGASRRDRRGSSSRTVSGFAVALGVALVVGLLGPGAAPAGAIGTSPLVDAPASYEPQTTCTRTPHPGTLALARWLMASYRGTGSMGMIRGCHVGGTSEHKDGRAFDWRADVRKPRQRRAAYGFIAKALATDAQGNAHALARRMGIMYIIYNDRIWSSYRDFAPRPYLNSGCKKRKRCSATLRHRNHVHLSLSFAGAAAQTSWYRERNVASEPVLHPGTRDLDADATAVTALTVPATGSLVTSSYTLRAGVTYRIVATGTVGPGPAPAAGDASCTSAGSAYSLTPRGALTTPVPLWTDGPTAWWSREGSRHPASPYAAPVLETQGLLVNGALRWEGGCRADHTYEAWFTPTVPQRLQLRYADLDPADNAGTLTVYVARDDITAASLAR
jgi:hypothetical protein